MTVYIARDNDQLATSYVTGIMIKHPGLFYIDTMPPEGFVEFNDDSKITNSLDHVLNLYVDDSTTSIKSIALRDQNLTEVENGTQIITLGRVEDSNFMFDPVQTSDGCEDFKDRDNNAVPEMGYLPKLTWRFRNESGLIKVEAKLKDYGNNDSCQQKNHQFMKLWEPTEELTDILILRENRDYLTMNGNNLTTETSTYNTAYVSTNTGKLYRLEPFPYLLYNIGKKISKLQYYNSSIYLFVYDSTSDTTLVYRDDKTTSPVLLTTFTSTIDLSEVTATAEYSGDLYFGMKNGQLWSFNGSSFSLAHTFVNPVHYLSGDTRYLYIGFMGGEEMYLFDGTTFTNLALS